jgi:ABC-2 type transport system ATP-binding protein
MIDVNHLTKRFPGNLAVDDISFQVEKGEVVGFLGPNGAGKTTTMRILTGYLPPTGGEIRIGGLDVTRDSLAVRRNIGYLPENCPLYPEMRVNEYLRFRARIKGVRGRHRRNRVEDVKELCGLATVGRRIIGQLSKGYRQRVGLADALVNQPALLILDEPTIGLDPNQIREIRHLVRDLARAHTILLSTHILSEVEATCDRVLILHRGKLAASGSPANLAEVLTGRNRVVAEIQGLRSEVVQAVHGIDGVIRVDALVKGSWVAVEMEGRPGLDFRRALFDLVVARGWRLRELRAVTASLEDAFGELTSPTSNANANAAPEAAA